MKGGDDEKMDLFYSLENKKDHALDSVYWGFTSEEQEKENVDDSIDSSVEKSSKNIVSSEESVKACMGSKNSNIIFEPDEVGVKACMSTKIQSNEEGDE